MAKAKTHEADQLHLIAQAGKFSACVFLGAGRYVKREAASLAEARAEALKLAGIHAKTPMIYALIGESRQIFVPSDYQLPQEQSMPAQTASIKNKPAPITPKPGPHPTGKRAQREADARAGKLPEPPDFSAATHTRFRERLDAVVKLVKAGDVKGIKAKLAEITPNSTSPRAIHRYGTLAIMALEAKKARGRPAR